MRCTMEGMVHVPFEVPLFYEIAWSGREAKNEKPLQNQGFCKGLECKIWYAV